MSVPICRHIKSSGLQCRAVALSGAHFCYFHHRLHIRHKNYRRSDNWETVNYIVLSPLEDRDSVQMAISQVVNAIAVGQLQDHRALLLLKGLQIASRNLRHSDKDPLADPATDAGHVRHITRTLDGIDIVDLSEVEIDPPSLDPLDYLESELIAFDDAPHTPPLLS